MEDTGDLFSTILMAAVGLGGVAIAFFFSRKSTKGKLNDVLSNALGSLKKSDRLWQVTEAPLYIGSTGTVRNNSGETMQATPVAGTTVDIPTGSWVRVVSTQGSTLVVERVELPA